MGSPPLARDKLYEFPYFENVVGSPPLARDKSYVDSLFSIMAGITPACAGQIVPITCTSVWNWDHPRLRGTNEIAKRLDKLDKGSPPLARDKYAVKNLQTPQQGITPA